MRKSMLGSVVFIAFLLPGMAGAQGVYVFPNPYPQVTAVRLLGCETAVTDAGQRTLRMLSQTLRLPVFGTRKPLLKSHCTSAGFDPAFAHILTVSRPPGTPFSR